jgi:alpha-tubulin suppressor-like RCC1 family protein
VILVATTIVVAGCGGATVAEPVELPPPSVDPAGAWSMVAAADGHTCGLAKSGRVFCWGRNDRGQIGNGTHLPRSVPTAVTSTHRFASVAAGRYTSCAVADTGEALCWGFYNTIRTTPTLVSPTVRFSNIAIGEYFACGVSRESTVYCWSTISGDPEEPTPLAAGTRFLSISAGYHRFCGVAVDRTLHCWLENSQWASGASLRVPIAQAMTAIAVGGPFTELNPQSGHACGLTTDAMLLCWGANEHGQLGDGSTVSRAVPRPPEGELRFSSVAADLGRTCAVSTRGHGYCWGATDPVDRVRTSVTRPKLIDPELHVATISIGPDHHCLVTPSGAAYCWGRNGAGQLGRGTTEEDVATPVRVIDPTGDGG